MRLSKTVTRRKENTITKVKAARVSIVSNSLLISLKFVAGALTGSVSLIAEGIHSLMDLAAAVVAFVSVRASDKPPDYQHPYGHGKIENISGVVEAALIFVAAGIILYEAIGRLITGSRLELLDVGIAVIGVSIVVNILVSRYLSKVAKATDSIALEADAGHLSTDVMTMIGVLIGLIVVRFTGITIVDPIVAISVAGLTTRAAYGIAKKSSRGLVDARLPDEDEALIKSCLMEHRYSIVGFHALRSRKSGSHRHIDLHLVVARNTSVENAHLLCDHLEKDISERLPRCSINIHVEPCSNECAQCSVSCAIRSGSE
jgi:cation diffusion facilitator family transporter